MTLFALCINPLLHHLDQRLQGIRARGRQNKTTVVAYADDVFVLITTEDEVEIIRDALRCYEKATGGKLNVEKSGGLAVGNWETSCNVMGIPYKKEITILGIIPKNTIKSSNNHLDETDGHGTHPGTKRIRRDLNVAQRITYVQTYLLSKLW